MGLPVQETIKPVTTAEVKILIKGLKTGKAPEMDRIDNKMFKLIYKYHAENLVCLYQRCIELNYFPALWETAQLVILKKPGKDPTDPGVYRPISLLKTPGKILEKLISARICVYVYGNNLISKNQYGFRPGLSPDHALKEFYNFVRTTDV